MVVMESTNVSAGTTPAKSDQQLVDESMRVAANILALIAFKKRYRRDTYRGMKLPAILNKLDKKMNKLNDEMIRRGLK